jgi:hypothetical protein
MRFTHRSDHIPGRIIGSQPRKRLRPIALPLAILAVPVVRDIANDLLGNALP